MLKIRNTIYIVIFQLLAISNLRAAFVDARNDSFTVTHYGIHLDMSQYVSQTIAAYCDVSISSKIAGLDNIELELYKLKVDSIKSGNKAVAYLYNDSLIYLAQSPARSKGDTFTYRIYYHGAPKQDPGKWGGFYFGDGDGGYGFNLGIGLYSNPHNMGRVWFPCVDNFMDKALFDFYITTIPTHKAFCNGLLMDSSMNSSYNMWHWQLDKPIVPYLASVGASTYTTMKEKYNSMNGPIDIVWGVLPSDTSAVRGAFRNIQGALSGFEKDYGPYPWPRVGYMAVEFNNGAMEHASNITYPRAFIEAGISYEYLWAHELSHQWWGDLITCHDATEMWLNEGWATFSQSIFEENIYGQHAYDSATLANHYITMRYAWVIDSTYRAISPMPVKYTYGPTVYNKGADAIHSLRAYLGDSLFFGGIKGFLKKYSYQSVTSLQFDSFLSAYTGRSMDYFFTPWIFSPGFCHFNLSQLKISGNKVSFNINQVIKAAPALYTQVPLEITVMDSNWHTYINDIIWNSNTAQYNFNYPANVALISLNMSNKISDAVTREQAVFNKKTSYVFQNSLMNVTVNSLKDSALFLVEHHWVTAQQTPNLSHDIRLADRYWVVNGIWDTASFDASATVYYDGRTFTNPSEDGEGYLDNDLIQESVDSMKLMYRHNDDDNWVEYYNYKMTVLGPIANKYGYFTISHLQKGQYCFAMSGEMAGVQKKSASKINFEVYPNPAKEAINVVFPSKTNVLSIRMYDNTGKQVYSMNNNTYNNDFIIQTSTLSSGMYILYVQTDEGESSRNIEIIK